MVDIGEKARTSNTVVDSTRRIGVYLRNGDIPCSALHRRTACTIAIRYNLPGAYVRVEVFDACPLLFANLANVKIRRLQLKLTSLQDFDAVLTILKTSGVTLIDSTPPTAVRGSRTADIAAKGSTTGHSALPVGQAIVTHSGFKGRSSSSDNYVTASEDVGPINPPHIRMRSDDPSSETLVPSPSERPPSWPLDRPITSGSARYPLSVQQHRPSTALPRIDEHENAPGPASTGPSDLAYPHLRPSTALTTGNSHQQNLAVHSEPTIYSFRNQRHDFSREPHSTLWGKAQGMAGSNQCDSRLFSSHILNTMNHPQRPSTAGFSQIQNDLTTMIPPRRELPFKRSSTAFRRRNQESTSSEPSTSTIDLPPLPKPNFIGKNTSSSAQPSRTKTVHTRPVSRRDGLGKGNKSKLDRVRPSTNHGTQTESAQFAVLPTVSASPPSAAPNPTSDESLSASPKDVPERIRQYLDHERESLACYATLPNEERMKILDGQIIPLIGDESFAQLCEDLTPCWQRIGLEI